LIARVGKQTGTPMVLNTSLNAYNDPMACEPHQAMRTFFCTGLDALVMGNFVLDKKK
jgi:carbamoyltransferase